MNPPRLTARWLVLTLLVSGLFFSACTSEEETAVESATREATEQTEEPAVAEARQEDGVQVIEVTAGDNGFEPGHFALQSGVPARIIFTRTTESECLEQVQIPSLGIEKTDLPLNEPVTIEFTPTEGGEFTFSCGMDMQHGTIVVRS